MLMSKVISHNEQKASILEFLASHKHNRQLPSVFDGVTFMAQMLLSELSRPVPQELTLHIHKV